MRVLVVASQKGGAGKTTLSGHLAVQADDRGSGPVAMLDTDPQRGLSAWWDERKKDTPAIVRQPALSDLGPYIAELAAQGFKLLVVDTPPQATTLISEVIRYADLVLVPVRPSPHDLRAVGATIDMADTHQRPVVFVVTQAVARARLTAEATVALSQHGTVSPVTIHSRVDFAASMIDGRTVQEADPNSASANEIAELWKYIETQLNRRAPLHG